MDRKLFFSLMFVLLFVSGCATTSRQASTVGQLQVKVAQLEQQVEESGKQVEDLRYDVQDLQAQVGTIDSADAGTVEETASKASSASYIANDVAEFIRVPVDPKDVQTALKNAGYYQGKIDGKIGSGSQKAIMDFQRDNNIKNDGIVGKQTWSLLKTHLE